jgi:hypothetical protein
MIIKRCEGFELEKEQANQPLDLFNRSEVSYVDNGEQKTLHVLYLRYFDEKISEFTPYNGQSLFQAGDREVRFKDIVAVVCLLNNEAYQHKRRVYINNEKEFVSHFEGLGDRMLQELFQSLEQNGSYEMN